MKVDEVIMVVVVVSALARAQQYPGVVAYSGGRRSERGVAAAALARDFVRESVDAMR